jgi:hypothetical protein
MATAKKGRLVAATEWWKHLRWTKRAFWKRPRQAGKRWTWATRADDRPRFAWPGDPDTLSGGSHAEIGFMGLV